MVKELDAFGAWTKWQDDLVSVTDLDAYVQHFMGRMKACPSFDGLNKDKPENEVFGSHDISHRHFSNALFNQLKNLSFPTDILHRFEEDLSYDTQKQIALMNPMNFLTSATLAHSQQAPYFRICLGSKEQDMVLAFIQVKPRALLPKGLIR